MYKNAVQVLHDGDVEFSSEFQSVRYWNTVGIFMLKEHKPIYV